QTVRWPSRRPRRMPRPRCRAGRRSSTRSVVATRFRETMADPTGEADKGALKLDFDRRLLLQFRGSAITSDAGLLPYRELDDTLGLTDTGANTLADARTGKNGRHRLAGLLRQSVFGRLAGYDGRVSVHVNFGPRSCLWRPLVIIY